MSNKYYVFTDENGNEVARKEKGKGRPPVGPTVTSDEQGNIIISNCVTTVPADIKNFKKVEVDGKMLYYPKPSTTKVDPEVIDQAVKAAMSV